MNRSNRKRTGTASGRASPARLWAPWRSAFLSQPQRGRSCIFCAAWRSPSDRAHLVIARAASAFAMLNLYPYNNGHILVTPARHVGDLRRLRPDEWGQMLRLVQQLLRRLTPTLHPHGFNVGMNLGRVAGAGIPGHLHIHLVPRWKGDTNFMPLLGQTKVISQSLNELYRLLAPDEDRPRSRR